MTASAAANADGDSASPTMTEKFIIEQCKKHGGYSTPELNEKLYLHHFGFTQLNGLQAFTGCTVLYLSHNALTRLDGLAALTQLDSLFLSRNALTSLSSMPALPALRTLDVTHNALTTLHGLDKAAPQLSTLLASHNRIGQLSGLQDCTALVSLDLSHNALEDEEKADTRLRPLRPCLRTLMLNGNGLCRAAPHYRKRWIATFAELKFLDEYPVFAEERERAEAFVSGGAAAEQATRQAQRARAEAEAQTHFQFFTEVRDASRAARHRDGPTHEPTAYYLAHTAGAATAATEEASRHAVDDDDDGDVYIPTAASAVHADPQGV